MKLSHKIRIDRMAGRLLCAVLWPVTRMLGLLLKRDHTIREGNVRSILVAKFYGLGSIIHATPMLRALKQRYPAARLIFVTRKSNLPLFPHIPSVDSVLCVEDKNLFTLFISNVSVFLVARNRYGFFCSVIR